VLISGEGVGFNDVVNAPLEHPPTIRSDGNRHRRLRSALTKPLMPAALKEHRPMLNQLMADRVDRLVGTGTFDAISEIASHLPLNAISHLVGLPDADRRQMLRWASASFNTIGPLDRDGAPDADLLADLSIAQEVRTYLMSLDPATLAPGSWANRLFEAAAEGRLTHEEARSALSGLVLPSLDTTILAKGNLLFNLAQDQAQYAALRRDPAMISAAVSEGVRYSAVVRWFSRVAAADYVVADGAIVPAGARVMLMYGSANRDPRRYLAPERFDIARNPTDQLGWGTGPHMCGGMHLARLEIEVMLEVLVERVAAIEADTPVVGTNRGLYGFDTLPLRLLP
jgi:cytochrome P450